MFVRTLLCILSWGVISVLALPHCEILSGIPSNLIDRGVINVVYTMKRKCKVCYGEANMLLALKQEMLSEGIMINVVIGLDKTPMGKNGELPAVKTNVQELWTALGKENGHIFLIDGCERLTYQVISPWSLFMYPFVRAGIMATSNANPCGICEIPHVTSINLPEGEKYAEYPEMEPVTPIIGLVQGEDGTVPLTILVPEKHRHRGSSKLYDFIELQTGNPEYHGHPQAADEMDSSEETHFDAVKEEHLNTTGAEVSIRGTNINATNPITDDYEDHSDSRESNELGESSQEIDKLRQHYQTLVNWI